MNAQLLPSHLLRADAEAPSPPHPGVLLILLFDTSTSVTGDADAAAARFDQAATVLERSRPELVAVRTFDRGDDPVRPDQVDVALAAVAHLTEGSSRLRPALLDAERLARAYPRHRTVLAVFSDFQLLDSWPAAVLARLRKFPGEVQSFTLGAQR